VSCARAARANGHRASGGALVIGYLQGVLAAKRPPWLTLEVAGVGYELEAPMSTFYQLPKIGANLKLVTHLLVRDDAHLLYGFSSEAERVLFRSLLKVSGVGARIALAILSGMSVEGFYHCVREKDLVSMTRVPGIGRKTAERLLVEMADRLPEGADAVLQAARDGSAENEAQGALVALGYKSAEVAKMLKDLDPSLTAEELIRQALKRVHKG
jgi:Holliday junction DNA helicase RuvA